MQWLYPGAAHMFQSVLQTLGRNMDDSLKWRESWSTGIEMLDVQHAELAACLNSKARIYFEKARRHYACPVIRQ